MDAIDLGTQSSQAHKDYEIEGDWSINKFCNFECSYCLFRDFTEHPMVGKMSPEEYLEFFNSTGKTWLLHLSGGEPFFHPDFIHLCRAITSQHYISVNSNLSSARVRAFAEEIDPARVKYIHCSVHVEERDRRSGWKNLAANVSTLLEHGFPVFASLVMTPAVFASFPRASQVFEELGVALAPKAIRGNYENRWYPQAYTQSERAQFRRFSEKAEQFAITSAWNPESQHPTVNPLIDRNQLEGFPDFTGLQCSAGRLSVSIGLDGNIHRCGHNTLLGNIFERRLDLLAEDTPCDDQYCHYWCLRYSAFDTEASANYPRMTTPLRFRQPLVTIRAMRQKIRASFASPA